MCCLMDIIKNWGGHIMSVLGILGGLWAYFRHDRKIKSQEKILNDLQIKQMEKELEKESMADMKARIISGYRGNAKIRFINAGKVDAQNVRIVILSSEEDMSGIIHSNWGPYNVVSPQLYREENLALCEGHSDTINLKIIWDDEYQKNRSVSFSVPF